MVQHCCVVHCTNRLEKRSDGGHIQSFHRFPHKDAKLRAAWISRISRENPDGSEWTPSLRDRVCGAHFTEPDYKEGQKRLLKPGAVPSIFPNYPNHLEKRYSSRRAFYFVRKKFPRERPLPVASTSTEPPSEHPFPEASITTEPPSECPFPVALTSTEHTFPDASTSNESPSKQAKALDPATVLADHCYTYDSVETHLENVKQKLDLSWQKQTKLYDELKNLKKKIQRRDVKIKRLLDYLRSKALLEADELDILGNDCVVEAQALIENEVNHLDCADNNHKHSEDLQSFEVSLHFL